METIENQDGEACALCDVAGGWWELRLYVAGQARHSLAAFANLHTICERYLRGRYHIEVVDLLSDPDRAEADRILAVPTLVRRHPFPQRQIVGDLGDTERVLAGLGLRSLPR